MSPVRVRFAPSPTGYLHVGGARTALFNWLFARHYGGKFILRIEDTDLERSSAAMVEGILEGLRWLGLDWDEGPFFQSQRLDRYQSIANELVRAGKAYPCYCSEESLSVKREVSDPEKRIWKYDGTCRRLPPEEVQARERQKILRVIRFKVPAETTLRFEDQVFGSIETDSETVEDFVLMRSDGMPTYHLGVVFDDLDMGISHVIRGADHISNTPKQILLYQALGRQFPIFAHVPLILGPDKSRLSKRHGATSVTTYRDQGYLPEAFRNFLALLGWSPGGHLEKMSTNELVQLFSLGGINKSNAVFNLDKLMWLNGEYLTHSPASLIFPYVQAELEKEGLWNEQDIDARREWLLSLIDLYKSRAKRIPDFVTLGHPLLSEQYETEREACEKFLKDPELRTLLPGLAAALESLKEFTVQSTEEALRSYAAKRGVKAGLLINAARVMLTGKAVAPPLFDVMALLGQARSVERLQRAY